MSRLVRALIVAAAIGVAGCAALGQTAGSPVTIGQLEGDPDAFDGKLVTVSGRVSNLRLWPGFRTHPEHKFELVDGAQKVSVLWAGWPVCRSGSSATVDGRYRQRDDIITASWVNCS
jgi:hypothetical protein